MFLLLPNMDSVFVLALLLDFTYKTYIYIIYIPLETLFSEPTNIKRKHLECNIAKKFAN